MTDWVQKASESLLPLSEAHHLNIAISEWYYTGHFFDFETATEICELCSHQDLRYHFEIRNKFNGNCLDIGSECIKRFDLTAVDDAGTILDPSQTAALVDKHRRKLVEDARQKRVMTSLLKLGAADSSFDASSFLKYVDGRGAFTPKQLAFIFWRLQTFGIGYQPKDFKLSIRRDREKDQLRTMKPAALDRVWPALSSSQVKSMEKIKARFEQNGRSWR